jgi:hypothetical protein
MYFLIKCEILGKSAFQLKGESFLWPAPRVGLSVTVFVPRPLFYPSGGFLTEAFSPI